MRCLSIMGKDTQYVLMHTPIQTYMGKFPRQWENINIIVDTLWKFTTIDKANRSKYSFKILIIFKNQCIKK